MGKQVVDVRFRSRSARLVLYVSRGDGQDLLGRDWLEGLQLESYSLTSFNRAFQVQAVQPPLDDIDVLLNEFKSIFEDNGQPCSKAAATLYLKPDVQPIFRKPRSVPYALLPKVNEEIDRLLDRGVIKPIEYSAWAAPCVIVRKPNGKIRLCADFSTGLNKALELQTFPLPTIEEIFTKLNGGETFSVLDLSDAYLSIPVEEESQKLLVINTIRGLFKYTRMCFGIAPAPAIFQRVVDTMLSGLKGVAYYLDDIIVTGRNKRDHMANLVEVFKRIREYGFHVNKEKSKFFQKSVNYLGHTVSAAGLQTSPQKVDAILKMPPPADGKQLESFMGMVTYFSKFIPRFSDICFPLNRLRQKTVPWEWVEDCNVAFRQLKNALSNAPVLAHYDPEVTLVVAADASSVGIGGCILHRFPDGTEKPIAYASKTLTQAEKGYAQIEREALAIIFTVKKFKQFLLGREFILQTDHRPLLTIFGSKKGIPQITASRLQRWALLLMAFTYTVEYVPTSRFGKADGLSRLPVGEDSSDVDEGGNIVIAAIHAEAKSKLPITCNEIAKETEQDEVLQKVTQRIQQGWPVKCKDLELRPYFLNKQALTIEEGCILLGIRTVIPQTLRPQILQQLHETHSGIVRMKATAREYVWWPGMDVEIEQTCRACAACNAYARNEPQRAYDQSWPTEDSPWSRVHLDFAGPFFRKVTLHEDLLSSLMYLLPSIQSNVSSLSSSIEDCPERN
ncbi:hypothetical protein O3M35_005093 [Rhynocoris fuscipes]|uniref:RNA-directed DNA polymerase n=1 Tax=Rhynocoris fuscipes TaxID=488301 RepID=A0AAW1DMA3_9HEMI